MSVTFLFVFFPPLEEGNGCHILPFIGLPNILMCSFVSFQRPPSSVFRLQTECFSDEWLGQMTKDDDGDDDDSSDQDNDEHAGLLVTVMTTLLS